jgi:hypothetical protein
MQDIQVGDNSFIPHRCRQLSNDSETGENLTTSQFPAARRHFEQQQSKRNIHIPPLDVRCRVSSFHSRRNNTSGIQSLTAGPIQGLHRAYYLNRAGFSSPKQAHCV